MQCLTGVASQLGGSENTHKAMQCLTGVASRHGALGRDAVRDRPVAEERADRDLQDIANQPQLTANPTPCCHQPTAAYRAGGLGARVDEILHVRPRH